MDNFQGTTFTVGNFKGGVGKTKIVSMLAYDNAIIRNRKTLIIDLDPQANLTQVIARTFGITTINTTITTGIAKGELASSIININENLDLLACDTSFRSFSSFANKHENELDQVTVLKKLLLPIKNNYQEIFIDVPPTISEFSDNAMAASDYSIISFQTAEESLEGVNKYVNYQKFMVDRYNLNLQIIDIVPCMVEPNDDFDKEILEEAIEKYGTAVSKNLIHYQKRLRRYSKIGIQLRKYKNGNFDQWDYKAHQVFINILAELDARQEFLNK
ncbi:ParA family protein [Enterococcus mundtii]|uniref:ParA family protein n=1 Tax=Enterococcus mundtii TaxID=53346 RepID=UPI0018848E9D|nr:ParA family protein [Enterococcus mundtii]MBE9912072.1 ParA family protein [Enterococcus mundtii]